MTTLTLNRRLAELLGWAAIIETGGALLGTPPPGEYCVRNQCLVPDWAGDWRDCGPLIAKFGLLAESMPYGAARAGGFYVRAVDDSEAMRDAALREAVAVAVIAKLEAAQ